jgi:sulfofructose kinase
VNRPLVVGVGHVGVALTALADAVPAAGATGPVLAEGLAATPSPGVATALASAMALGCRARLGGLVGGDSLGLLVRNQVGRAGIDVESLRPRGASPCHVMVATPQATHLLLDFPGHDDGGVELDLDSLLTGARALLVDGSAVPAQIAAAERARAEGIPVIVDGSDTVEGLDELIAVADVLLSSERLASELAPRAELRDALGALSAMGPRAVVITLGATGALGLHDGQMVDCTAFPVEVIDTCGAGAVFHGAFAAGLLGELPFVRCVELAAAAAALSCRRLGPWDGVPGRDEVLALARTRR